MLFIRSTKYTVITYTYKVSLAFKGKFVLNAPRVKHERFNRQGIAEDALSVALLNG